MFGSTAAMKIGKLGHVDNEVKYHEYNIYL